jgi:hypothetical protein
MNTNERRQALETILQQKLNEIQLLDTQKNALITEIIKIQGKLDLLKELEIEEKKPEVEKS